MSQIKPIRYKLCITNDAVDESKDAEGQLVNSTVEISYDSMTQIEYGGKQMQLSLFGLSFDRKMYEPGHIEAEVLMTKVVAVDIDENSVRNAQENAEANGVTIDVRLGANVPEGAYDLIMANIHRNILLAQMADYARYLTQGGELWLSGFYEADCPTLIDAAKAQGLQHTGTRENGEWRMICLRKG